MSEINFKPWVGKDYFTKGYQGQRILVLGESHYCKTELAEGGRCHPLCQKEKMDNACYDQTQDDVHAMVYNYEGYPFQQTFLCFERAVAGKVLPQKEREEFWESVMFYNYIQYALPAARINPNPEHWGKSEKAFVELLEKYSPDKIIVWGARLYNDLPDLGGHGLKLKVSDEETADVWVYNVNGKDIPALKIHHPSAPTGKNWEYWHEVIDDFLKREK